MTSEYLPHPITFCIQVVPHPRSGRLPAPRRRCPHTGLQGCGDVPRVLPRHYSLQPAGVRGCAPRASCHLRSLRALRRLARTSAMDPNALSAPPFPTCWVGRGAGICPACSQVDMTAESAGVRGCAPRAHKLCCAALRCAGSQSAMDPNATAFEGECCRTRAACTRTQRSPTSAAQSILACADLSEQPCLSSTGAAEHSCGPTSWQSWSTCSCALTWSSGAASERQFVSLAMCLHVSRGGGSSCVRARGFGRGVRCCGHTQLQCACRGMRCEPRIQVRRFLASL